MPDSIAIRPEIRDFLGYFNQPPAKTFTDEELIQVSSATKRVAFAYERFRNTLEPDEEEILRRRAILRVLERRLFEDRPAEVIAMTLLQEIIRANYIRPCPRSYIDRISRYLKKAKRIYAELTPEHTDWFLHLVAVALDHELFPPDRQEALVHLMYHDTYRRVVWSDDFVAEADRPTQLYLACHRALFAADDNELAYHYFAHHFPAWRKADSSDTELAELIKGLPSFRQSIDQALNHPARDRLTRFIRPVSVPYQVLRGALTAKKEAAVASQQALETAAQEALRARLRHTRSRMSRRAWHSILFLFLTKTLLALFIEIPYERFLLGGVHYLALATNIAFHPVLLFAIATTVRFPGQVNAERILEQINKIVTGNGELPTVIINAPRRYGSATWSAFAIIYAALFMAIFWALFSFLDRLNFSLLAMLFFVVFLGLVSFLATRIRRSVDNIRVIPRKEGAMATVLSFLALPVLEFGRWLAQHIRQLNVLLFLMDRVLEAPFKILIDILEEWFDFVRDRREEIVK